MVRSTQPMFKENASRQKENMHVNLGTALTRLEEASKRFFNTRMEELIFPEKIWLICETNLLSRFMTWGDEVGYVMINLEEFEAGLLSNHSTTHLFKTGKLVSFIRQFNLYDFKKKHDLFLDLDGRGSRTRFGLYFHQHLRPGHRQMLALCARKVVKRNGMPLTGNGVRVKKERDEEVENAKGRRRRTAAKCADLPRSLTVPSKSGVVKRTSLRVANRRANSTAVYIPVFNKEAEVRKKEQKEYQRTSLIQRWLEMPKEWNELPELRKKESKHQSLFEAYNWNLDPMVVGDLAALASYGVREDNSAPMTDQDLANWMKDMDKLPVLLSVVSSPVFQRL